MANALHRWCKRGDRRRLHITFTAIPHDDRVVQILPKLNREIGHTDDVAEYAGNPRKEAIHLLDHFDDFENRQ